MDISFCNITNREGILSMISAPPYLFFFLICFNMSSKMFSLTYNPEWRQQFIKPNKHFLVITLCARQYKYTSAIFRELEEPSDLIST
jgi:hypothetical protein